MEIHTKRLMVRKIDMKDDLSILEAMECPQVSQMHSNNFTNVDKVHSYINVLLKEYNCEKIRTLAIAEKGTNKLIGLITVDYMSMFSRIEFSYWINTKYRNVGYATESVKAMIEYSFNYLNTNRIQAMTSNPASERVLEKAGMTYEGTLRQYFGMNGIYWDVKMYAILHKDFAHAK